VCVTLSPQFGVKLDVLFAPLALGAALGNKSRLVYCEYFGLSLSLFLLSTHLLAMGVAPTGYFQVLHSVGLLWFSMNGALPL